MLCYNYTFLKKKKWNLPENSSVIWNHPWSDLWSLTFSDQISLKLSGFNFERFSINMGKIFWKSGTSFFTLFPVLGFEFLEYMTNVCCFNLCWLTLLMNKKMRDFLPLGNACFSDGSWQSIKQLWKAFHMDRMMTGCWMWNCHSVFLSNEWMLYFF